MKMFEDQNMQYIHSAAASFSTCSSNNSSFPSDTSSWGSLSTVATPLHTLTRQGFDLNKLKDASLSTTTLSCIPERNGIEASFCDMNSLAQDMLSGFHDGGVVFSSDSELLSEQGIVGCNNFSTYVGPTGDSFGNQSHISPESQSFDGNLFSPISDLGLSPAEDFVVPSQTTFMDNFDMNSPLRPVKSLQLDIQYDTPVLEYDSSFEMGNSPAGDMKYFLPSYTESRSCSTTPSKSSPLRQPMFQPLQTSAALQSVQEETKPEKQTLAARQSRRQMKRKRRHSVLPNNIRVQKLAKKECPFEGCNSRFQRQEHLKRHEETHYNTKCFPCEFCPKHFGRSDNLKSHIWLHAQPPKRSSRTVFHPRAMEAYESMSRKSGRKWIDSRLRKNA